MKIENVEIVNFRLLHDLTNGDETNRKSIDLDDQTTVIVGKNNSGKTSFSHIFKVFLESKHIWFHDFSIDTHKTFIELFEEYRDIENTDEALERFMESALERIPKIQLILTIRYFESDNWSLIRNLFTSLDESDTLKIKFEYLPKSIDTFFKSLEKKYSESHDKDIIKCVEKVIDSKKDTSYHVLITPYTPEGNVEPIKITTIDKIIGKCFISANREVADSNNPDSRSKRLSRVFQKEYQIYDEKRIESDDNIQQAVEKVDIDIDAVLDNMNFNVDGELEEFFKQFVEAFSHFGYPNIEGSKIQLKSNITTSKMFESILLFFNNNEHLLPEEYNGLGYSNLIYLIAEMLSFKTDINQNATDLNLIFLEEPEAHMHPQLQCAFITNLNGFLEKNNINAQIILTTHSSHVVADANFESIRYFNRYDNHTVVKDLVKFDPDVQDKQAVIKFLKQYITQVKCDMFFADKIILIEGTCERLLMPIFMEKIVVAADAKPFNEQYISLIEISGNYMHNFKSFIEFLDIKTLIITDIDSCKKTKTEKDGRTWTTSKKCEITEDILINDEMYVTTNQTLIKWLPCESKISILIEKRIEPSSGQIIGITYQRNVSDIGGVKCGRTFEEAFIIENAEYIFNNKKALSSIKNTVKKCKSISDIFNQSYRICTYIDKNKKKTQFAFDLIYIEADDWKVPTYIEEGLLWLAK